MGIIARTSIIGALIACFLVGCSTPPNPAEVPSRRGGQFGAFAPGPDPQLPNGGRPLTKVAFPKLNDRSTLVMKLERSQCFGTCPAYSIEVHGDGTVVFDGKAYVAIPGHHVAKVSAGVVDNLFRQFQTADFFWLLDRYASRITDAPTYVLSISFDGNNKTVLDYMGRRVGMPVVVTNLEDAMDTQLDADRWVVGNSATIPSLRAEKWDFSSPAHEEVLAAAARMAPVPMVEQLARGASKAALNKALVAAAGRRNGGSLVRFFLANGADPRAQDAYGVTALHLVARAADPSLVALVLSHKPDVNAKTHSGDTPLIYALHFVRKGQEADQLHVVKLLLKAGADPNAHGRRGETPLMQDSVTADLANLLLSFGADPNARDDRGRTALFDHEDDPALMGILLAHGGDPKLEDNEGRTALHGANQNAAVAALLIHAGADPNAQDQDGMGPLHRFSITPDVAAVLLRAGADPNLRDNDGDTPLATVENGRTAALLIAHGADLKSGNKFGETPFAANPWDDAIAAMLDAGADPKERNRNGESVLARIDSGALVKRFLKLGLDPNARDKEGNTPLMRVRTVESARSLIDGGALVNVRNRKGQTALFLNRDEKVIKLIIKLGANVNARDNDGNNALAANRGYGAIRVLVKAGLDPNATNKHGEPPLLVNTAAIEPLLQNGADPCLRLKDGSLVSDRLRQRTDLSQFARDLLKAHPCPSSRPAKDSSQ